MLWVVENSSCDANDAALGLMDDIIEATFPYVVKVPRSQPFEPDLLDRIEIMFGPSALYGHGDPSRMVIVASPEARWEFWAPFIYFRYAGDAALFKLSL
jgi:hypothetical protein